MSSFFFLVVSFIFAFVDASHYRGGSFSYTIRPATDGTNQVVVRITQRHSWRLSAHSCNDTSLTSNTTIGEGSLTAFSFNEQNTSTSFFSSIDATVKCTDFSQEFDYSSGESLTTVYLPVNSRLEYRYQGCCWIPLLTPDASTWSLPLIINTNRRADGSLNNSPKTTMNPIVQVELGKSHRIRVPMGDSDGDPIRCRWGISIDECGDVCSPKGSLTSDPCEFSYNASSLGYRAVALIIEDFDTNGNVLSSVPLQFLIHIVNSSETINDCAGLPEYVGDWLDGSCLGVQSNVTMQRNIPIRIPCANSSTTLINILTISPTGLERGEIQRDPFDPQLYTMSIEWTPTPDQYGIQQMCFTPVDSLHRTGSQTCVTFQVDVLPPKFLHFSPQGLVSSTQSQWTIIADRDIVRPRRLAGVFISFVKKSTGETVYSIDAANDTSIVYDRNAIRFSTRNFHWEAGEEYSILLDTGIATINESCGIESEAIYNSSIWSFHIAPVTTPVPPTQPSVTTTTAETTTNVSIKIPELSCPRWLSFRTISNETTNENRSKVIFCFKVETDVADVTIAANTWVSCPMWKLSGMADPLIELYTWPQDELLAENDDGNSLTFQNCFASVISYRLKRGDYRVIIRHPKCSYGSFELRLSAEIDRNVK